VPTFTTTTLRALEAALRTRIDGITPDHEAGQSSGWHYAEDRDMPAPSMVPRLYSFEWSNVGVVPGGATGNGDTEVSIDLDIVVDYRAFPERDLAFIVESDHWNLADRIFDSWSHDLILGLSYSESRGFEIEDAQRVVHGLTLYYMRDRRGG
jgi:hypothetical protein